MTVMFNKIVYLLIAAFLIGLGIKVAMGYYWYSPKYATVFYYGEHKEVVGILFSLCSLPFIYWVFRTRKDDNE